MMIRCVFICLLFIWSSCVDSKELNKGSNTEDIKVGLALYSINRFPLKESLKSAKNLGVRYVEGFSFQGLGKDFGSQELIDLTEEEIHGMKTIINGEDLTMISSYVSAETRSEWERYFSIGKKLGLKFLIGEPDLEDLDFIDSLAGVYDLKLAIHNHAKDESQYWSPDIVLARIQGKPHLAACVDLGHWARTGLDLVKGLKKLQGHILSLHVKDVNVLGDKKAEFVPIGEGVIDFSAVVKEIKRQKFNGIIYVESENGTLDNTKELKKSIAVLRELLK